MSRIEIIKNIDKVIGEVLATSSEASDGTKIWTVPVKWGRGYSILGFGRFSLDYRPGIEHMMGWYEPEVVDAMGCFISKGSDVIDAGAHAGYLSIYLAKIVGCEGRVFSFEPAPLNREILLHNVRQNGVANVEVSPFALSDRTGCARFMIDPSSYENRLVSGPVNSHRVITVPTTTLDLFIRNNKINPTFIKMDIEGAELAALNGARQTLRDHRPIVVAEVQDAHWSEIKSLMEGLHYSSRVISKPGGSHCQRGTPNILFTPC